MRIVILGSGQGTNCEALINAQKSGALAYVEIVGVLSDQQDSGILKIAQDSEIHQIYLGPYTQPIAPMTKDGLKQLKNISQIYWY